MSSFLNVPFLPVPAYQKFLLQNKEYIREFHFALPGMEELSSWQTAKNTTLKQLCLGLARFPEQKKFVLLDGGSCLPEFLLNKSNFNDLIRILFFLTGNRLVDGIIFNDFHLLQRISAEHPGLAEKLEAVPDDSFGLDSFVKIDQLLNDISGTSFKKPAQVTLDVNVNRDLDSFNYLINKLRTSLPTVGIEVIANEGCLYYCPLRRSHKAKKALGKIFNLPRGDKLSRESGCVKLFVGNTHVLLQSPFIRPENINNYLCYVDTIKIYGADLGSRFLMNCIKAYIKGSYSGNLLDLLSSVNWLAEEVFIDNSRIPDNFFEIRSQCNRGCSVCGFCKNIFNLINQPGSVSRPD